MNVFFVLFFDVIIIECFTSTYGLSGFKSRIKRDLLTIGSF